MTTPDNHEKRAVHVKATWGKRCNILFFVSSVENSTLPTIALNVTESRNILWGKSKFGFKVTLINLDLKQSILCVFHMVNSVTYMNVGTSLEKAIKIV